MKFNGEVLLETKELDEIKEIQISRREEEKNVKSKGMRKGKQQSREGSKMFCQHFRRGTSSAL